MRRAAKPVAKSQVSSIKPSEKIAGALPNDSSPRNYSGKEQEETNLGMEYEVVSEAKEYSPKSLVVGLEKEEKYPYLNIIETINTGKVSFDLVETKDGTHTFYVRYTSTQKPTRESAEEVIPRNVITSLLNECKPECFGVAIYDAKSGTHTIVTDDELVVVKVGISKRVPLPVFSKEDLSTNKTKALSVVEKVSKRLETRELKICDKNLDEFVATYNSLHKKILSFVERCDETFLFNPEATIRACEDTLEMSSHLLKVAELIKVATNTLK